MLLPLDPDRALELIESPELIREEQVIPGQFRPFPGSPCGPGRTGLIIRVSDCGRGFNVPRLKPAVI
jgi:hypothetical protein